jgi:hypothetical protein
MPHLEHPPVALRSARTAQRLLSWVVVVAQGLSSSWASAQPKTVSATPAAKTQPAKPPRAAPVSGKPRQTGKGKKRAQTRAAPKPPEPGAAATAKPAPAAEHQSDAKTRPTQVLDFDADDVGGQRMEPGYELIQAAPRRARHPSLVPFPPKPDDSVVGRP